MDLKSAINILSEHNKWRRDNDGKHQMTEPKELGIAIDTVVSEFKNLNLQNTGVSLPSKDEAVNTGFNKVVAQNVPERKVFRNKYDDKYYSGWLDCFDWISNER